MHLLHAEEYISNYMSKPMKSIRYRDEKIILSENENESYTICCLQQNVLLRSQLSDVVVALFFHSLLINL